MGRVEVSVMATSRDQLTRTLLLVFAGITSVALLIAAIALLIWVKGAGDRRVTPAPTVSNDGFKSWATANDVLKPAPDAPGTKHFTLRLGQGFRFKDGAIVTKPDDMPDIVFKYVPPQVGGLVLRYNPIKQNTETKMEPTLSSPAPLLLSTRIDSFIDKPIIARITTGEVAGYDPQATVGPKTRYVLLQNQAGDHYFLTLDELEAVPGKYDDWRIGFAYEKVQLPLGLAGGQINKPLPGKLIFRDWVRTKMMLRVDLTTGKEEIFGDGSLPSVAHDGLFGYVDTSGAYVIRDATAGKDLYNIRFNERVVGPVLSPDGKRVLGTVDREGPPEKVGTTTYPALVSASVGVFDLAGKELVSVFGYDDAAWTPDGKIIATGRLNDPGLFEIDPATKAVRPIDAQIPYPSQPSVSPDGKTIAFITGSRVWTIDRDGKNMRQVFQDGHVQQRPVFSPDGTKIAAVICNQLANEWTGDVFVIDLKTQEVTPLRTSAGWQVQPDSTSRLNWIP
jgi:hypothetical protein